MLLGSLKGGRIELDSTKGYIFESAGSIPILERLAFCIRA